MVPSKEELKETFGFDDYYFASGDDFITDKNVLDWMDADMKSRERELGKFERVKEYMVKRNPFSPEAGEMTPTQKIKRKVVEQKYAAKISEMYAKGLQA